MDTCFNYVLNNKKANLFLIQNDGIKTNSNFIRYDILREVCLYIGKIGLYKSFNPIETYNNIISGKYSENEIEMLARMLEDSKEYYEIRVKENRELERKVKTVERNGK